MQSVAGLCGTFLIERVVVEWEELYKLQWNQIYHLLSSHQNLNHFLKNIGRQTDF